MSVLSAKNSRGLKVIALAIAFANAVLWFGVVWLRDGFDTLVGRFHHPHRPVVSFGVQELLVYFDPWLANLVFPIVYTIGLMAIAFLFRASENSTRACHSYCKLALLLLSFEAVWILLIVIAVLCRGPDWNFYWPWEPWHLKLVPLNHLNFSDIVWWQLSGNSVPYDLWIVREAPGLLLGVAYLLLGLIVACNLSLGIGEKVTSSLLLVLMLFLFVPLSFQVLLAPSLDYFYIKFFLLLTLAFLIFAGSYLFYRMLKSWGRSQLPVGPMPYWRSVLFVLLVQLALLVPAKVALYWAFNMKYFVYLPEFF